jgi:hypothetical protein
MQNPPTVNSTNNIVTAAATAAVTAQTGETSAVLRANEGQLHSG